MAGGLSHLQKTIMLLILGSQEVGQGFLRSRELLERIWGETLEGPAYNAAHASLSRCITRLWGRNLLMIWKPVSGVGAAVSLTDAGIEEARRIREEE